MPGPPGTKKKACARLDVKEEELVYDCEWEECKQRFLDIRDFLRHMGKHINEHVANAEDHDGCFSCCWRECGSQILGNLHDFNRHVYFHAFHVKLKCLGELLIKKGKAPECSIGGQSRNWIPELPENLQCGWTQCGVVCDNPVIFYSHVNQHAEQYPNGHKPEGGCTCHWTDCDAKCKTKYKLTEHLRSHTQEKVVACPTCGGLFANRTKFFDHLTRQKESSVYCYQCSHCNKRFATERLLRDHMRHHVNHYKCPFCDMTCPAPSSLRTHIKYRHTLEKPYKCAHCDHCTKSASDLRRHMESHSSEASVFRCNFNKCDYTARSYSSLANHYKRVHQIQEMARYACHICDLKVTRGSQLTKHLKKKHKFKWPPGHSRFRYKVHEDGTYRLQTIRYESIEVTEQMMEEDHDTDDEQMKGVEEQQQGQGQGQSQVESEDEENTDPGPFASPMSLPVILPSETPQDGRGQLSSRSSNRSSPSLSSQSSLMSIPETASSSIPTQMSQTLLSMPSIENTSAKPIDLSCVGSVRDNQSKSSWTENQSSMASSAFPIPSGPESQTLLSMPSSASFTFTKGRSRSPVSEDSQSSSSSQQYFQQYSQQSPMSGQGTQSEQAAGAEKSSGINFTLISDPGSGLMSVQKLRVNNDGILVFNENSQNDSQTKRVGREDGANPAEEQQKVTYVDAPVLANDDAYNLEMLGHVALLGQNLPTPQLSSDVSESGKMMKSL